MTELAEITGMLLSTSPVILALLLGLMAVGICGFALYLVYRVVHRGTE